MQSTVIPCLALFFTSLAESQSARWNRAIGNRVSRGMLYRILDVIYSFITQCNNNHQAALLSFMDMKHRKARIAEEEVLPHQKCMIMRQPSKKNGTAQANECWVCHEKMLSNLSCIDCTVVYHKSFFKFFMSPSSKLQTEKENSLRGYFFFERQTTLHYELVFLVLRVGVTS